MKGKKVLHSSASDEWSTPQDFFELLNKEFQFTLDGAATSENKKCKYFSGDYLNYSDAAERQTIWLNPPYSMCAEFMKKSKELSEQGHTVVCLIPARTDTKYWHAYCAQATEIRFIKGRLKFGDSVSAAPFPSAIVIFDSTCRPDIKVVHWDWKKDIK